MNSRISGNNATRLGLKEGSGQRQRLVTVWCVWCLVYMYIFFAWAQCQPVLYLLPLSLCVVLNNTKCPRMHQNSLSSDQKSDKCFWPARKPSSQDRAMVSWFCLASSNRLTIPSHESRPRHLWCPASSTPWSLLAELNIGLYERTGFFLAALQVPYNTCWRHLGGFLSIYKWTKAVLWWHDQRRCWSRPEMATTCSITCE